MDGDENEVYRGSSGALPFWEIAASIARRSGFRPRLSHWIGMWPSFCGRTFASVSKPIAFTTEGVLLIEVEDEHWGAQLRAELPRILSTIATMGWGVEEIQLECRYKMRPRIALPPNDHEQDE